MSIATNVSVTRECTAKLTHECMDSIILYNTLEGDMQHEMSSVLLVVAHKYKVQPRSSKMKLVDCYCRYYIFCSPCNESILLDDITQARIS